MNGEINGTMGEPMEVSQEHNSDENSESHCDNSNNSEKSNTSNETTGNPLTKSNGDLIGSKQNTEGNILDSCKIDQGDSEDSLSSHSTNSNEPCYSPSYSPKYSPSYSPKYSPSHSPKYSPSYSPKYSPSCSPSYSPTYCPTYSPQNLAINEDSSFINNENKDGHYEQSSDKTDINQTEDSGDSKRKEESSDGERSVLSTGEEEAVQEADVVSINSDSESDDIEECFEEIKGNNSQNDVIIIENDIRLGTRNRKSVNSGSPDVHEILSDNDDCVMTDDKSNSSNSETKTPLRRSNRAIKPKKYDDHVNGDDEFDIEEIEMDDPVGSKPKSIIISDTKKLVEMTAIQIRLNQGSHKKEPTLVILDSNKAKALPCKPKPAPAILNANAQSLYQSIAACGTTVTPVKANSIKSCPPSTSQAPILLPSLSDDMFVVEAPSFIVPYVYEKPSLRPFREFVDILGKQLDDERAKKEKDEMEKRKKEKKERKEDISELEVNNSADTENQDKKQKKAERKELRMRTNIDDDASWDGESCSDSEVEALSDAETLILREKEDSSIEEIKDITDLSADNVGRVKSDNYFDCSLGKFFVTIGLNLVQEYVQTDLLKQQNRKLSREKKTGNSTIATQTSIASLIKNLEISKENNAPYHLPQIKCEFCSFKTESTLVMQHHLQTPHMKNNIYQCNFCLSYTHKQPLEMLIHMEEQHTVRGSLERAPSYHQCPNCPFEENGKGKFARHQIACAKKFKPEDNLAPPIEWESPAKIPKISKSRNSSNSYQHAINRQMTINKPISITNLMPGARGFRPRGRSPMGTKSRSAPVHGAPSVRGGITIRHNSPSSSLLSNNYPVANNDKTKSQPSISITPLPRQTVSVPQASSPAKTTFVICEICDGYIKDLEQLRNHMQWIHKVRIHPKMIYNRPPLNCQKCQFRFFTDQGLERHLLGSHGLVTTSMQEAANKGKDAGRCPVCGRVYQWKLLNHVAIDHNITLKPAHLSYKCTVCTSTFGMYKQFENHVYSAHSVVAKRVMDKNKPIVPPKPATESTTKPLKINDEITVTPQPATSAASTKT